MSDDLFQIFCKSCGSKLNAKTSLIGQTRNCPKCKTPILIQREETPIKQLEQKESIEREKSIMPPMSVTGAPIGSTSIILNEPSISERVIGPILGGGAEPIENLPERLQYRNRYVILNSDRIVAVWESGKGWQVNVGGGFAPAKNNTGAIPDQGTFDLVEIVVDAVDGESMVGGGPKSLNIFKISQRGALTSLYRDESEILEKVDCTTELSNNQKSSLMNYIRQHFMFESLVGSQDLLDSLSMQ